MATLKNNSGRARGIPVGHGSSVVLAAGESATITDDQVKNISKNRIAKSWLDAGLISVVGSEPVAQAPDDSDRKDELIAELAEYGITKNKRSSVESLEEALAEAIAATEPEGEDDAADS